MLQAELPDINKCLFLSSKYALARNKLKLKTFLLSFIPPFCFKHFMRAASGSRHLRIGVHRVHRSGSRPSQFRNASFDLSYDFFEKNQRKWIIGKKGLVQQVFLKTMGNPWIRRISEQPRQLFGSKALCWKEWPETWMPVSCKEVTCGEHAQHIAFLARSFSFKGGAVLARGGWGQHSYARERVMAEWVLQKNSLFEMNKNIYLDKPGWLILHVLY